jgi:hypothetical protein
MLIRNIHAGCGADATRRCCPAPRGLAEPQMRSGPPLGVQSRDDDLRASMSSYDDSREARRDELLGEPSTVVATTTRSFVPKTVRASFDNA